jgi:hypothetical protein
MKCDLRARSNAGNLPRTVVKLLHDALPPHPTPVTRAASVAATS